MARTVGIVQARTTSTRLPGKVLRRLGAHGVLELGLTRLARAKTVDVVVLATTDAARDDVLEEFAVAHGWPCWRGSEDDVLARYHGAAHAFGATLVVRQTADCPLVDPRLVDFVVEQHRAFGADYTANKLPRTFPIGLEVEAIGVDVLDATYREARTARDREHVTPFIIERPDRFRLLNVEARGRLRRPELRLTIDLPGDLEVVGTIVARLPSPPDAALADVLDVVERDPALAAAASVVEHRRVYDERATAREPHVLRTSYG